MSGWSLHESECFAPLWVIDVVFLEDFGNDGHGRVYRVRDDENECVGSGCRNRCSEVTNDARIDLSAEVWRLRDCPGQLHVKRVRTLKRSSLPKTEDVQIRERSKLGLAAYRVI